MSDCHIRGCNFWETKCRECGRIISTCEKITPNRWISIEDELPEPEKIVLFFYNNEFHVGYFIGKSKYNGEFLWQSFIDGYNCVSDVKFWFSLPEMPNE